jgi:predicted secreted protein
MAIFVALYSGPSVGEAQLIAVSVDRSLVADVSARLLQEVSDKDPDPVVAELEKGRRGALRLINQRSKVAENT